MFGNAQGLNPGNLGMKLFKPSAAPALWWDPNNEGLPIVGAYRAIATVGSPWSLAPAVYADTLQNWANPGTYDLTEIGGGPPNWAVNVGWSGFNALGRALDTSIVPILNQTWTMLVEYSNAGGVDSWLFGLFDTVVENGSATVRDRPGVTVRIRHGMIVSIVQNAPSLPVAGNYGFAGLQPYRDAAPEALLVPVGIGTTDLSIWIGDRNSNGALTNPFGGNIAAFVVYSGTLAGAQVAAVDAAMGQL